MASVVEVLSVHAVIFHRLPPGGLHLPDIPPGFGRHNLQADIGVSHAAPSQIVQLAVALKGLQRQILRVKVRPVVVQHHIRLAGVVRYVLHGHGGLLQPQLHQQVVQRQRAFEKQPRRRHRHYDRQRGQQEHDLPLPGQPGLAFCAAAHTPPTPARASKLCPMGLPLSISSAAPAGRRNLPPAPPPEPGTAPRPARARPAPGPSAAWSQPPPRR